MITGCGESTGDAPAKFTAPVAEVTLQTSEEKDPLALSQGGERAFNDLAGLPESARRAGADPFEPSFAISEEPATAFFHETSNGQEPHTGVEVERLFSNLSTSEDILELARLLHQSWPGAYNREIHQALLATLLAAQAEDALPGELFQLLGETGSVDTLGYLQAVPDHFEAYAQLSRSLLRDGSGIPSLVQDAEQLIRGNQTLQARLAVQLLAQEAYRRLEAEHLLMSLAEQGLIPSDLWQQVFEFVAGTRRMTLRVPASGNFDLHTIYRAEGTQAIYHAKGPLDESNLAVLEIRRSILERLMIFAPNL